MKALTLCDHRSAGACRCPRAVSGLVVVSLTVELHQGECEVHVVGRNLLWGLQTISFVPLGDGRTHRRDGPRCFQRPSRGEHPESARFKGLLVEHPLLLVAVGDDLGVVGFLQAAHFAQPQRRQLLTVSVVQHQAFDEQSEALSLDATYPRIPGGRAVWCGLNGPIAAVSTAHTAYSCTT